MGANAQYNLTVEDRDSYIFARVKGEAPPGGRSVEYLEPIADHCVRCMCTSMLIEKHTPEPFAIWDAFVVAPRLARIGAPSVKIAVVEKGAPPPPKKDLSVMIGQTLSLDVQVFDHVFEAKNWLLHGKGH